MKSCLTIAAALVGCALQPLALAQGAGHDAATHDIQLRLDGYQEVPSVSTSGKAFFWADLESDNNRVAWRLRYEDLEGDVQQAHIHFARRGVAGGIVLFLCSNLGNGPAGTPTCPGTRSGQLSGFITPADISPDIPATAGAIAQGIEPGEYEELGRALRAGALYVNVHSTRWPTGEVRGQLWIRQR